MLVRTSPEYLLVCQLGRYAIDVGTEQVAAWIREERKHLECQKKKPSLDQICHGVTDKYCQHLIANSAN